MLSSTPYAQHKHNEQKIAAESLLDMESLQQKVMEQEATIERLIAIVSSCSDLAGVNLDNFCNAEKIENIRFRGFSEAPQTQCPFHQLQLMKAKTTAFGIYIACHSHFRCNKGARR